MGNENGCHQLIEELYRAVAAGSDVEATTRGVKQVLCDLIEHQKVQLPMIFKTAVPGSYARRLVHKDGDLGFTVLAMAWGPGQGTPLHDHSGMWCVEAVVEGQIEVCQFRMIERAGSRFRFEPEGKVVAGIGSAGRLIPPFEYHTIANALPNSTSVTIHVYGGEMQECSIFDPRAEGWWERSTRRLAYTA
ncbi:MAG: cysteine dioxygenase family protein [Thermoanaerobaculia bacterium]|nr:cysteine dioxygenase family protein [Thermoanaerobaculia bacterium]